MMGGSEKEKEPEDPFARIATALRDDAPPHHSPPLKRSGQQRSDALSNLAPIVTKEMVPEERPEPMAPPPRATPKPLLPSVIVDDPSGLHVRPTDRVHIDEAPTTLRGSRKNQQGEGPQRGIFGTPAVLMFLVISIMVFVLAIAAFVIKRSQTKVIVGHAGSAATAQPFTERA
jgi:hypothetical protein